MAHSVALVGIAEGETTRRAGVDIVSSNYFATFGIPLFRGRAFTQAEERPGSPSPVVVVSYAFWKKTCIVRSTFVIDKSGAVRHVLYGVNARGHASNILNLVKELE